MRDNIIPEEIFSTKGITATNVHVWLMVQSSAPKNNAFQVISASKPTWIYISKTRSVLNYRAQRNLLRMTIISKHVYMKNENIVETNDPMIFYENFHSLFKLQICLKKKKYQNLHSLFKLHIYLVYYVLIPLFYLLY